MKKFISITFLLTFFGLSACERKNATISRIQTPPEGRGPETGTKSDTVSDKMAAPENSNEKSDYSGSLKAD